MKILLLASCIIAFAAALPAEEVVVPEQALFEAVDADFEAARTELQQLRAKKTSDKDCRKLADATENEVTVSVKAQQKTLDSLDKGKMCPTRHAQAVRSSKKVLDKAKADKKKADDIYAKAKKTRIKFDIPYDQMTPGQCSLFFNKPAYKKVHTSAKQAKYKADIAKGSLTTAQKAYDAAVRDQKKAINKCQCDVKKFQKATLVKMNSAVKAANEKLYKKAANLRCLLDGTPASKCKVGSIPVVVPVKLTAATAAAKCRDGSGPKGRVRFNSFTGGVQTCPSTKDGCLYKRSGSSWNAGAMDQSQWILKRNIVQGGYGFCATRHLAVINDVIGFSTSQYFPHQKTYHGLAWAMYAGPNRRNGVTVNDDFGVFNNGKPKFRADSGWKPGEQACLYITKQEIRAWMFDSSKGWHHHVVQRLHGKSNFVANYCLGAVMYSPQQEISDIYWIREEPITGTKVKPAMATRL